MGEKSSILRSAVEQSGWSGVAKLVGVVAKVASSRSAGTLLHWPRNLRYFP
jgi:hypothetical protein